MSHPVILAVNDDLVVLIKLCGIDICQQLDSIKVLTLPSDKD